VAKSRAFRLKSIAETFAKQDYDIIALQEVWVQADFELIRASVQHTLPYSKYFYRYIALFNLTLMIMLIKKKKTKTVVSWVVD
jgi:endonuclease/exonuclease/phosphatase family metal-dependent hydrolase